MHCSIRAYTVTLNLRKPCGGVFGSNNFKRFVDQGAATHSPPPNALGLALKALIAISTILGKYSGSTV